MRIRLFVLIAFLLLSVLNIRAAPPVAAATACGLSSPAFCEPFDAPVGGGGRSGQLDGTLWGASRITGDNSLNGDAYGWPQSKITACGAQQTVQADGDIFICNGQMTEGMDDQGNVTSLAMYPRQPFDFAGRTGKITFDVSNDSGGIHGAWPELWVTDQPVPGPFVHEGTLLSLPRNGFGVRFAGTTDSAGNGANCAEGPGYVGVDSAITVANYVQNDSFFGGSLRVTGLDCVKQPTAPGQLNHYELDVSQGQIDVYGTDAGTVAPIKHLATIKNAGLNFTRGLVWIEDAHYNGDKGCIIEPSNPCQGTHAFTWDNVGFDGPVLTRDLGYEVPDANTATGNTDDNNGLPVFNLGWTVPAGTAHPFTFTGVADPSSAAGALLEFNFYQQDAPVNFSYTVNGIPHTFAWPYPDTQTWTPRAIAIPLALSDLVAGTDTFSVTPSQIVNVSNFDLILAGAGGGGSATPTPGATPTSTATPSPTATPSNTPTPGPTATATSTPAPFTLGLATVGAVADDGDANNMNGSRFTTGAGGTVTQMSVYVGSVQAAPNNQYQLAIYADNHGTPGTLITQSAIGTLTANSWNSLPVSAALAPNTAYWLMYNANATNGTDDNMTYDGSGTGAYAAQSFGTWPTSFGAASTGAWTFSINATGG